jgi:hypothetical protein
MGSFGLAYRLLKEEDCKLCLVSGAGICSMDNALAIETINAKRSNIRLSVAMKLLVIHPNGEK